MCAKKKGAGKKEERKERRKGGRERGNTATKGLSG
jgi:hypothetical protein